LSRHPRGLHSFPTRRSSDLCWLHNAGSAGKSLWGISLCSGLAGYLCLLLPVDIFWKTQVFRLMQSAVSSAATAMTVFWKNCILRSEEHTSELQSRFDLVCRL